MTKSFSLCYVVTEMAFNTVASLDVVRGSLENIVAYIDNVVLNPVTVGQSSGAQGSNSTEEQKSGNEVQFNWRPDEPKSEWIRKLELGLDAHVSYGEEHRVVVMKLPDFKRKPEEHYTPQHWRFGLHDRDLQASTTVASTTESEGLKISLAAACNLKSDRRDKVSDKKPDKVSDNRRDEACHNRWTEFCDKVVHNPDEMVLKSYGLHPSVTTNFSKKEVQSLLTLDALTLLLVLSYLALCNSPSERLIEDFISWLETGGLEFRALLNHGVAYNALMYDLFLFENQIPMDLLKNVISKCYLLPKGQNPHSDTFQELNNPQSPLSKEFLHKILMNLICQMCIEIFEKPCSEEETLSDLIDTNYPVGSLEDCAHIFACVYKILTTFPIKEESSTTTKSLPHEYKTKGVHIFGFVYKILTAFYIKKESSTATIFLPDEEKTKESASDREQLPHATSFGNSPTILDIRETSPIDLEQPGDCELQTSRIPEAEHDFEQPHITAFLMRRRLVVKLDLEQPGDCESRMPAIPGGGVADAPTVEKQLCGSQIGTVKKENLDEETLGSATDLRKAGLRIKANPGMIKAVAFKNGCLSLPILQLNDNTESYFRNLAMYEVYGHYGKESDAFSDYLQLMSDLIKTQEDVAYLIDDCKVIRNLLGTHQNAFKMWERLQSGIELPPYSKNYKTKIVIPVNRHCASTLNKMRTEFYNTFCSKPWLVISVISAVVLLLATLIQTYVAVIGSDKMQPHFPRGG
jgi:hypothetical protein